MHDNQAAKSGQYEQPPASSGSGYHLAIGATGCWQMALVAAATDTKMAWFAGRVDSGPVSVDSPHRVRYCVGPIPVRGPDHCARA